MSNRSYSHLLFFCSLAVLALSGCTLDPPPQCVAGQIVCMQSSEGTGQVMKICGSKNGDWANIIACDEFGCNDEGTACKTAPLCSLDENYCVEAPQNLSVSFHCVDGALLPTVCEGTCNEEDNTCYKVYSDKCEQGQSFCVKNSSKLSMEFSCSSNGNWNSKYCQDGCDEAGEHCVSSTSCMPAESTEGAACDAPNAVSAECRNGKCIPTECEDTYKLQSDVCLTGAGCISNGKINCCDFTDHQTVVKDNASTCTYVCRDEYLDCDGDSSNCEVDKAYAHMSACETCVEGYGNCDDDWATGCEIKLVDMHLSSCGVCDRGWGNCDGDWSNGCEIKFEDMHKQTCDQCMPGYCKIDNICVNMTSSADACGDSCLDCSSLNHVEHGNCVEGACRAEICESGYETNSVICCKSDPHGTIDKNETSRCSVICHQNYAHNGDHCCPSPEGVVIEEDASTGCNFHCASGFSNVGGACVPNDCTLNETKCFVGSDGKGSIRKCIGTGWETLENCSTSCDATNTGCGACSNGDKKCDNIGDTGQLSVCKNGKWEVDKLCDGEASCKNTAECGSCKNGATKCRNDGKTGKSSTCSKGTWSDERSCDNNNSCKSSTECGNCISGNTECRNDVTTGLKRTCSDGKWGEEQRCDESYSCNSTKTGCGLCINNDKKCSGSVPQRCDEGKWTNLSCSGVEHGAATCENGGDCGFTCSSGYCKKNSACVSNKTDMDNCGSCGAKCTTSTVNNSKSVKCENGHCIPTACINGYTLSNDTCIFKNCTEGATRCTNVNGIGKIEECKNNAWTLNTNCTEVSCKNGACGDCKNDAKRCTNNSSKIGVVQTCRDGTWGDDTNCGAVSCKGNACGYCINDNSTCTTKDMHTADVLTTCTNGTVSTNNCPAPSGIANSLGACSSGTACGGYKCVTGYCPFVAGTTSICAQSATLAYGCGMSCEDCSLGIPPNSDPTCTSGICDFKCKSGFHKYTNGSTTICEADNSTNCGYHNHACNSSLGNATCQNGRCQFTSCQNGYRLTTVPCNGYSMTHCLPTAPNPGASYVSCAPSYDSHILCQSTYSNCEALKSELLNGGPCYYKY